MKTQVHRSSVAIFVVRLAITLLVLTVAVVSAEMRPTRASTPASPPRGIAGDLWADKIIGQPRFSEIAPDATVPNKTLQPHGVIVDRANQKFYVYDGGHNRILGFQSLTCITNPPCSADFVLGQPELPGQEEMTHSECNGDSAFQGYPKRAPATAGTLCTNKEDELSPAEAGSGSSMALDAQGNLYVVDFWNSRVLRYNRPFETDTLADYVWGQADFSGNRCNRGRIGPNSADAVSLCFNWGSSNNATAGVDIDQNGQLWVVDSGNNRVLRFSDVEAPFGVPDPAADRVLGQPNFSSNAPLSCNPSPCSPGEGLNQLKDPAIVRVDSAGRVYVTHNLFWNPPDYNYRVVVYDPPHQNGMSGRNFIQPVNQDGKIYGISALEFDPTQPGKIWVLAENTIRLYSEGIAEATPLREIGCARNGWFLGDTWGSLGITAGGDILAALGAGFWTDDIVKIPGGVTGCPLGSGAGWGPTRLFNSHIPPVTNRELGPAIVGIEVTNDQLIVAEQNPGRILFWNRGGASTLYDALDSGQAASGCAKATLTVDEECTVRDNACCISIRADGVGHLWVHTDRIYRYDLPLTQNEPPAQVIAYPIPLYNEAGQVNYIHYGWGMAPTPDGNFLWVTQRDGSRALRIRDPLTNPRVDVILGQTSAGGTSCNQGGAVTNSTLCKPGAISLDRFGNVWVSDHSLEVDGNYRLLQYDAGLFPADNSGVIYAPAAKKVFTNVLSWQASFDSSNTMVIGYNPFGGPNWFPGVYLNPLGPSTSAQHFLNDYHSQAFSSAFDGDGNLYVADKNRARVLVYRQPTVGRPAGLTLNPAVGSPTNQVTFTWAAASGAVRYELCVSDRPIPGGAWFCSDAGPQLSLTGTAPAPSGKVVYYWAVRAIGADGRRGAFSNRTSYSAFNETVAGTVYNSYQTVYKTGPTLKKVNGVNRHAPGGGPSRWLALSNYMGSTISNQVPPGQMWFQGGAMAWDVPELIYFVPIIQAIEATTADLTIQDNANIQLHCMFDWIRTGCE